MLFNYNFYYFFKFMFIGALTANQFVFSARSWELKTLFSIDFTTSFCLSILVFVKGCKLVRITSLTKTNKIFVWLTDTVRLFCLNNDKNRLVSPFCLTYTLRTSICNFMLLFKTCMFSNFFLIKRNFNFFVNDLHFNDSCITKKYLPVSWSMVLFLCKIFVYTNFVSFNRTFVNKFELGFLFYQNIELESMFIFKNICNFLGVFFFDFTYKYGFLDFIYILKSNFILKQSIIKYKSELIDFKFLFFNFDFKKHLAFLYNYNLKLDNIFFFGFNFLKLHTVLADEVFDKMLVCNIGLVFKDIFVFLKGYSFFSLYFNKTLNFCCFLSVKCIINLSLYFYFFFIFNFFNQKKSFFLSVINLKKTSFQNVVLKFKIIYLLYCFDVEFLTLVVDFVFFFTISVFGSSFYLMFLSNFYNIVNNITFVTFDFMSKDTCFYLVNEFGFSVPSTVNGLRFNLFSNFNVCLNLFLLKFDNCFKDFNSFFKNSFLIFCTSFGLNSDFYSFKLLSNISRTIMINLFLPVANFLEQSVTLVSCFGFYSVTQTVLFPFFKVKTRWQFLNVLFNYVLFSFKQSIFTSLTILRKNMKDFLPSLVYNSLKISYFQTFNNNFSEISLCLSDFFFFTSKSRVTFNLVKMFYLELGNF